MSEIKVNGVSILELAERQLGSTFVPNSQARGTLVSLVERLRDEQSRAPAREAVGPQDGLCGGAPLFALPVKAPARVPTFAGGSLPPSLSTFGN